MEHAAAERPRILIADDDRLVLSTLSAGLARAGYRVHAVDNGLDAVIAFENDPPDLAVLDHNMPGLSGLEALRRIRQHIAAPVLMLTAYDDAELVREAVASGVNGYFVKPIDSSQLVPSIELHLMRSRGSRDAIGSPLARQDDAGGHGVAGLLDRQGLVTVLGRLLGDISRNHPCAGICLDLDRFRFIAGSHGQHVADTVLQQVIERIRQQLRQQDVFARMGEDTFFVLLPRAAAETGASVARRLLMALEQHTFRVGQAELGLSACAGLTVTDGGADAESVIARASAAMQEAKAIGPGTLSMLDPQTGAASGNGANYEVLIRQALDHERIELDFQPILDLRTGTVTHYEALLRLRGEDDVRVPLQEFLPSAERYGLIRTLDYRVLELAARQLVAMTRGGHDVCISVNLSGVHFGNPALLRRIRAILDESALDPRRLIFEVTETAAVRDLKQASNFIAELKALGCQFALDDFGVGYASFYYLKGLPVDYIKIDGAFVRDLAKTASDRLFVKAMVDVARGLGVKTIAEHVNDAATLDLLRDYGVDFAQGFHIGHPGPLPDFPRI